MSRRDSWVKRNCGSSLRKTSSYSEEDGAKCQSSFLDQVMSYPVFWYRSLSFSLDFQKRSIYILPTWSMRWEGQFLFEKHFFKKSIIPLIIFVQLICASKYISGRNVWLCCSIATWMITLSSTASTYSKCSVHRIWLPLWSPVLLLKRSEWHKRFTVISQGKVR